MSKYVKFKLVPEQSPPNDGYATGIAFDGDWICWKAPDGTTFPVNNPADGTPLTNELMTDSDTTAYEEFILLPPQEP